MKLIFLLSFALSISVWSISNAEQQFTLKAVPGKTVLKSISEDDGLINADFPEPTGVRDIARAFSLWLDKPFEVDKNVHAKVKLISPERITKEEAVKRFNRMLTDYGLEAVEVDSKVLIVKAEKDCGPVPPGGTMDSDCNLEVASPPATNDK